jgi:tight adherence protein B
VAHGSPVATALAGWAAPPGASADVRLVAAALTLGAHAGGEVARAVDRIAVTLRERAELRGEVRALATQARASAAMLTLAPLGFAGLVASVEPAAIGFLLTTPIGLLCLVLGLALNAAGAAWMSHITRSAA